MSRRAKPTGPIIASAHDTTLLPSDDEDDDDFVAPADGAGSGSSDDSDSDDEARRLAKRAKQSKETAAEPAMTKQDVDDLWASFNAPEAHASTSTLAAPPPTATATPSAPSTFSSTTATATAPLPKKITITVEYKFVGETVTQEKEVLADSDEARAWLARQATPSTSSALPVAAPTSAASASASATDGKGKSTSFFGDDDTEASPSSSTTKPTSSTAAGKASEAEPPKLKPSGGPPRRARGGLDAMAAGLAKPVKLNTLEKSKMDWNKFVEKEELKDDLGRARKDGYLDKMDFLKRTEDKRDEEWEKNKSGGGARR